jgi:hypothetical protein
MIETESATIYHLLKYMHGIYNSFIILLFLYQGWLGILIREGRISEKSFSLDNTKRHRKFGPILALLGITGFFAGMTIVYLHEGKIIEHPLHFFNGLIIVVSIMTTFIISRKITTRESSWRTPHFIIGIMILCLYLIQALLGIGMIFRS